MPYYNDGKNNYSSNPAERPPQSPPEQVSSRMFNVAGNVDEVVHPERKETFNQAGTEFASGNFDKGQRVLETEGSWNDDIRGVATDANKAEQERTGEKPLDLDGAKSVFDSSADQLESSGTEEDKRGAQIVRGL